MAAVGASQTRVRVLGSEHSVDITSPIVAEGREGSAMAGGIPERVFNSAYEMSQNCQKFTSLRIWITSGTRTPPQQCSGLPLDSSVSESSSDSGHVGVRTCDPDPGAVWCLHSSTG